MPNTTRVFCHAHETLIHGTKEIFRVGKIPKLTPMDFPYFQPTYDQENRYSLPITITQLTPLSSLLLIHKWLKQRQPRVYHLCHQSSEFCCHEYTQQNG